MRGLLMVLLALLLAMPVAEAKGLKGALNSGGVKVKAGGVKVKGGVVKGKVKVKKVFR